MLIFCVSVVDNTPPPPPELVIIISTVSKMNTPCKGFSNLMSLNGIATEMRKITTILKRHFYAFETMIIQTKFIYILFADSKFVFVLLRIFDPTTLEAMGSVVEKCTDIVQEGCRHFSTLEHYKTRIQGREYIAVPMYLDRKYQFAQNKCRS